LAKIDHVIEAADLDWEFGSEVQRSTFLATVYEADRHGTVRMPLAEPSKVMRLSITTVKREAARLMDSG